MFTVGTNWTLNYRNTGSSTGTTQIVANVARQTTYNGQSAFETVQDSTVTLTAPAAGTSTTNTKSYTGSATATGIMQYGSIVTTAINASGASGSVVVTGNYTPAWEDRMFLMTVGQTDTVTYTSTVSSQTSFTGLPALPATNSTSTETRVLKFVGLETVTVPAGTFSNACRFEVTSTTAGSSGSPTLTTMWMAPNNVGVSLKVVAGTAADPSNTTQELTSGTVNGVAVRP